MRTFLYISLLLLPCLSTAQSCPLGKGQTQLTFDQVMVDFANLLIAPDYACLQGTNDATSVSDADLKQAIDQLAMTIDCANAVINDKTGQLYPPEYDDQKTDADKAAYLKLLDYHMADLAENLEAYRSLFVQLAAEPLKSRDFTAVENQRQAVDYSANDAHKDLQN